MKDHRKVIADLISGVSAEAWKSELDLAAYKYHITVLWVAIILDPLFAVVDYLNIPQNWFPIFIIRCSIALITVGLIVFRARFGIPSYLMVAVTFFLISLQNAYTYSVIDNEHLLGHNLNYMALLIGASLFVLWQWQFSVFIIILSVIATGIFIELNPRININQFILNGGLLLLASGLFMIVLVRTRYKLTVKEVKTRLALIASNEEIQAQAEEIKGINENLEMLVADRTQELEKKNKTLEEYAFINAHKLRSPVASILGLINLLRRTELNDDARNIMTHLHESTNKLDEVVSTITKTIEKGERKGNL
jgi:signal transduction histidine kinase